VEIGGLEGAVTADTGSGSMTVLSLRGDVVVHTGSESVNAYDAAVSLGLRTGSGEVLVEGLIGSADGTALYAQTGSGGIELKRQ